MRADVTIACKIFHSYIRASRMTDVRVAIVLDAGTWLAVRSSMARCRRARGDGCRSALRLDNGYFDQSGNDRAHSSRGRARRECDGCTQHSSHVPAGPPGDRPAVLLEVWRVLMAARRKRVRRAARRKVARRGVRRRVVRKAVRRKVARKAVRRKVARKAVRRRVARKAVRRAVVRRAVRRRVARKAVMATMAPPA